MEARGEGERERFEAVQVNKQRELALAERAQAVAEGDLALRREAAGESRWTSPLAQALLDAYQAVRPLTAAERQLLPAMARAAALRYWISRLWDFHLPREAAMLTPHDPGHFERVLRGRLRQLAPAATTPAATPATA